jgi:membrane protein
MTHAATDPARQPGRGVRVAKGQRAVRQGMSAAMGALWQGGVAFYHSDNLTHASSIAYFALLSLFPCCLLALSVLGMFTASDEDRRAVLDFVLRYFPSQLEFLTIQLDALRSSRVPLGVAGSILIVWTSLGVFGAVTTAVNYAWGVERRHGYWMHKLVSFLLLAAAGLLLLAALMLVSAQHVVRASWFAGVLSSAPGLAWLGSVLTEWATTVLFVAFAGLVFYFVPNTAVRFRDVWFGAAITGLLWTGALSGFSWYLRDLSRFSIHGSLSAVVVFLVWIYISAVIFLYGVEVTAVYSRLRVAARA